MRKRKWEKLKKRIKPNKASRMEGYELNYQGASDSRISDLAEIQGYRGPHDARSDSGAESRKVQPRDWRGADVEDPARE